MPTDSRAYPAPTAPASMVRGVCAWWLAALVWLAAAVARADEPPALENQVKAAFLVKFGQFVEWPAPAADAAAKATFTIGILGLDPFGDQFDQAVKNERCKGRPIQIQRGRELAELGDCQIIFFCASEAGRLAELLRQLAGRPVLTVADTGDFAQLGGMIYFIKEGGKVRFEINPDAAEKAKLKVSAKLMQVGKVIAPRRAAEEKGS